MFELSPCLLVDIFQRALLWKTLPNQKRELLHFSMSFVVIVVVYFFAEAC